jgi:hypothetical protein
MGMRGVLGGLGAMVMIFASACATVPADAPAFSRAAAAPAGFENLYIYRPPGPPIYGSPSIKIDSNEVASPPSWSYTVIPIASGQHTVLIDWGWWSGWPALDFPIQVKPGESLYLRIGSDLDFSFMYDTRRSEAQEVESTVAEREMKQCCRYVRPLGGP